MRLKTLIALATLLAVLSFGGYAMADDPDGNLASAQNHLDQASALLAAERAKPPATTTVTQTVTATVTQTVTATVTVTVTPTTPPPTTPPPTTTTPPPTTTTPPPTGCEGVDVVAPASIQSAINANPAGTTFCLSGTFSVNEIQPKDGNTFIGPATLNASAGATEGFDVRSADAQNVTFVDLTMGGFAERAIGCWDGTRVFGGRFHDNDINAIGCGLLGKGVLIDGAEIDHNGSPGFVGCCASGMKFAQGHGIVVRNVFVHDNTGNGVWCDVQCGDFSVTDSVIVRSTRKGVFYEKSGESDFQGIFFEGMAYVARNTIQNNGLEGGTGACCAGFDATSSKNVLVEDNTFGQNNNTGVRIRQDDRLTGDKHGWVISNVIVRNNDMNGDSLTGCNINGVTCTGNA